MIEKQTTRFEWEQGRIMGIKNTLLENGRVSPASSRSGAGARQGNNMLICQVIAKKAALAQTLA